MFCARKAQFSVGVLVCGLEVEVDVGVVVIEVDQFVAREDAKAVR